MRSVGEKAPDGPELAPAAQVEREGDRWPSARAAPPVKRSSGSGRRAGPAGLAVGMRRGLLGDDQLEPVVHVVGARPLDDEAAVPAPDQAEHRGRGDELARARAVELEGDRADAARRRA